MKHQVNKKELVFKAIPSKSGIQMINYVNGVVEDISMNYFSGFYCRDIIYYKSIIGHIKIYHVSPDE